MREYAFSQWLLLFYIFSFFGWIFESVYVSVRQRRAVNRGFLIGPWIPIYGFGGVIILFTALPFYVHPPLVFIAGMVAATVLEYFTGMLMEKLFAVKYWDYTGSPMASKNGYISLPSSLCWGVFSVLLTYGAYDWIEGFIYIPSKLTLILTDSLLTFLFTGDTVVSAKTAFNIKTLSQLVSKANEEMDEAMANIPEDLADLRAAFHKAREDGRITRDEWEDLIGRTMVVVEDRLSSRRAVMADKLEVWRESFDQGVKNAKKREEVRSAFRKERVEALSENMAYELSKRFGSVLEKRQLSVDKMSRLMKRAINSNPSASSKLSGFELLKRNAKNSKEEKVE